VDSEAFAGIRLDDVVGHLPDAMIVAEAPSGRILSTNRREGIGEGHPREATVAGLFEKWQIFHPDGRPYAVGEWPLARAVAEGEVVVDEEFWFSAGDGSRRTFLCDCRPLYDDGGRIVAAISVTREVTGGRRLGYYAGLIDNTDDAVIAMDARYVVTACNKGAERMFGWRSREVVGRAADDLARTNLSRARLEDLRAELAANGRWRGELVVTRKDGTTVDVELLSVAVRGEAGAITGYLSVHRDITERKRAEAEREARVRQQALVAELGLQALAADDLQLLMDEAVDLVARTLGVELAGIAETVAGGDEVILRAGVGWHEGVVGGRIEGASSLTGYGEPGSIARDHGAVSGLSAMIATRDAPFGTFGALSTRPRTFSPSDASFVQAVANVLASAVERNRAEQRLVDATEGERRRIARDLHDEALQDLTDAAVQIDRGRAGGLDPVATERLGATLESVSRRLRGAIFDLRSQEMERRPFREALQALVSVQRAMAVGIQVDLDIHEDVPAGALGKRGTEALRIVGEALTNARRHSGARNLRVTARRSADRLWLDVADDGRGFDPASAPQGGHASGLEGMRERAALLDGRLEIRSAPGTGTQVSFALALAEDDDGRAEPGRILVVDGHTALREAIAALFEGEPGFEVVGQAASLASARAMLADLDVDVDVAVLDLGLPDGFGADLIEDVRAANPRAQALVLTASLDPAGLLRALASGADATLDKPTQLDGVVDAVRRLRDGGGEG
jgi:PAS domain S-box-containing protein